MKDLKQHILEKLKVSKNSIYDITLEALIDALKDYKAPNLGKTFEEKVSNIMKFFGLE